MKTIRKHLRLISPLLSLIFIIYSCNVYVKPVDYETAINSGKKVKVTSVDKTSYKFTKIYEQDNQLIGLADVESRTAKKLKNKILSENDMFKYYILNKDEILKLNQISPVASVLSSIVIGAAVFLGIAFIAVGIGGGISLGGGEF
jgi:hypothetical protein